MQILSGKEVREAMMPSLHAESRRLSALGGRPRLMMVLVGDHAPSLSYVRSKSHFARSLGIQAEVIPLAADVTAEELHGVLERLNHNQSVHGILCQNPLPPHLDEAEVYKRIDVKKDVDGFNPYNAGLLLGGHPCLAPCTPAGVLCMLRHYGITTKGRKVVVLGRSKIVGRPMSTMLSTKGEDAVVTLLHSAAGKVEEFVRQAELVITAAGKPGFITGDMLADGAVVVDVGINRVQDSASERGYRIVGDVDFDSVRHKVSAITPVPGGVGLMTVCMLMANTLSAARWQKEGLPPDAIWRNT